MERLTNLFNVAQLVNGGAERQTQTGFRAHTSNAQVRGYQGSLIQAEGTEGFAEEVILELEGEYEFI